MNGNKNEELLPYYEILAKRIVFKDGKPYWLDGVNKGKVAGTLKGTTKYRNITQNIKGTGGRTVSAHRLVWFMEKGHLPEMDLDHINRDKDDNRIENLRIVTRSENMMNIGVKGRSRFRGVHFSKKDKRWLSIIQKDGKKYHIGNYMSQMAAAIAYDEVCYMLFDSMELLNFPKLLKAKKVYCGGCYKK
jgi:hypothetical protein